ncbi:ABC transporter permease (plasmid) [Rhizobium sp. ACO-34A]|nr:iron ABC transporter permease [Rhizobium sp. ACO-34A]ATN36627.1 ABC transporter permease [Rhizobium sp. ACO-34A]
MTRRNKRILGLVAGLAVLVVACFASLAIGSRPISLAEMIGAFRAYDPGNDSHLIVRELRLPRTIVALLCGIALGVAGSVMQAVTRNPLAEPGLLGVNAGAAAAVIIGISVFNLTLMQHYVWCGFIGAGLAGIAVFLLGQAHETGINPVRLVLAGAGISIVLGSVTGIVILNAPLEVLDDFRHWSAGSFDGKGFDNAIVLAIAVAFGLGVALSIAGSLNAVALGDELGQTLGVNVGLTWAGACLSIMLLAGAATAAGGPIGFVGLVAPHIARAVTGPDHRWILPYSALFAAVMLLVSDVAGRVIAMPAEVAAGIIALLIGGPFFIAVVRRFRLRQL